MTFSATTRIAALALLLATTVDARAEYRLGTGDVVEVAIFGMQDYRRRVTVNIDGNVSLPFLGEERASGLTIAELRKSVTHGLAANGTVRSPEVTVELIEHRPFYISGDVSRPGAQAYRPGMTVRHAVAVAGGYDALRFRAENPLLAAPEMQSQYDSHWVELVRRQARAISLQAELDGKDKIDLSVLREAPISPKVIEEIATLEARDFLLRSTNFKKERTSLERAIAQLKETVATLDRALRQSEASIEQQSQAVERTTTNTARGITPAYRVDEDRRALAGLRTQQVDAGSRLAQARRDLAELERRLDRTVDEHQSRLIQDLQGVLVGLESGRSQVRSAGERLLYTGAVKAQMRRGGGGPEVVIYRKTFEGTAKMPADENAEILPDDVVEVVIRPEQLVVTPTGGQVPTPAAASGAPGRQSSR